MEAKSCRFDVFTIHEYTHDRQIRNRWTRVGSAFENSDGSWNLRLWALPVANPKSGLAELHMRAPRPAVTDANTAGAADVDNGFVYNPDSTAQADLI